MATEVDSSSPLYPAFHCTDCGSNVGFRSRRRSFSERFILPILLLKPVRCGECFRRDYRWFLTPVKDRLSEASGLVRLPMASSPPVRGRNIA